VTGIDIAIKSIRIAFIVFGGLFLLHIALRLLRRIKSDFISDHVRFLALRGAWYFGLSFIIINVLTELGFHVTALIGAAGIVAAALGYASKTSLSNIISGLFLLTEHSFGVGEIISVSGVTGTVVGVGLLSIKLRQDDGTFVRIPHENMIKSTLINMSHFEVRRFDFHVTVGYKENLDKVFGLIRDAIRANGFVLHGKTPLIKVDSLTSSGVSVFVGVWATKESYTNLSRTMLADVKNTLQQGGIDLAQPYYCCSSERASS
jgi:small-conductance mechanosensitive channel